MTTATTKRCLTHLKLSFAKFLKFFAEANMGSRYMWYSVRYSQSSYYRYQWKNHNGNRILCDKRRSRGTRRLGGKRRLRIKIILRARGYKKVRGGRGIHRG